MNELRPVERDEILSKSDIIRCSEITAIPAAKILKFPYYFESTCYITHRWVNRVVILFTL